MTEGDLYQVVNHIDEEPAAPNWIMTCVECSLSEFEFVLGESGGYKD